MLRQEPSVYGERPGYGLKSSVVGEGIVKDFALWL